MRRGGAGLVCSVAVAIACSAAAPLPAQTTDQGTQVVAVRQVPRLRALDQAYLDAAAAILSPERGRELEALSESTAPVGLRGKLGQGDVTSVELTAFYLSRIGRHDEELRSVLEVQVSTSSIHAPFYTTAGWPAVTVPLGLSASGMPNGITIIGRTGEDERILAMAWAIERTTQARVAPPVAVLP